MKRWIPALLCVLLLTGCAAKTPAESTAPAGESPSASEADDVSETYLRSTEGNLVPDATFLVTPVTEEGLRAQYEADGSQVLEIRRDGDNYVVWYGPAGVSAGEDGVFPDWTRFDWVFPGTGRRVEAFFSDQEVLDFSVGDSSLTVKTNGVNVNVPYRGFPSEYHVTLPLTDAGELPAYQEVALGVPADADTWLDVAETSAFGMEGRREVVTDARIGVSALEVVFGPPADMDGFSNFYAAVCTLPATEVSFDEATRVMTVRFRNTALESGDPDELVKPEERENFEQWVKDTGVTFPTSFSAGPLGENAYFTAAEIHTDGADTVVTFTLAEKAALYTVDSGFLGPLDGAPYLRLVFRQADF
ncbi:MAG TPA: hypothetical protein PK597_00605 [Oscillospiraceae bacterium]|nr:hypothetical protein [Oscillospiraceae bacterium]